MGFRFGWPWMTLNSRNAVTYRIQLFSGARYWRWMKINPYFSVRKIKEWNSPHNCGTPLVSGITQCYLPPDRGDRPAFTPTGQVGTWFIDTGEVSWLGAIQIHFTFTFTCVMYEVSYVGRTSYVSTYFCWRIRPEALLYDAERDQCSYSTLGPVSAWVGDRLWTGKPPWRRTRHPGLHWARPLWLG